MLLPSLLFFVPSQQHRGESLQKEPLSRTAAWFLPFPLLSPYPLSMFALGFMNVKMVHSYHSRWLTRPAFWPLTQWKQPWGCPFSTQGPLAESPSHGRSASLGGEKKRPRYLQGELSWRTPRSLSQGLSSSPASLGLITYAHNPWLVHVIHQPGSRPLAPESPQLTCLLGGSWVAMATLIFSWQLGFSHGAKSLFSLCVSFLSVVLRPPLFVCFSIYGFPSLFSWLNCSHAELSNRNIRQPQKCNTLHLRMGLSTTADCGPTEGLTSFYCGPDL